jgi:hypothetical protein
MFVESGNIVARSGETLSFEYRFTVRLIMLDFAGSLDLFAVPILAWLSTYRICCRTRKRPPRGCALMWKSWPMTKWTL